MVSDILFGAVMGIGQSLSAKRDFEREIFKQDQEKAARMEELREEYRLSGENALALQKAQQETERLKQEAQAKDSAFKMQAYVRQVLGPDADDEVVGATASALTNMDLTPAGILNSQNGTVMVHSTAQSLMGGRTFPVPPRVGVEQKPLRPIPSGGTGQAPASPDQVNWEAWDAELEASQGAGAAPMPEERYAPRYRQSQYDATTAIPNLREVTRYAQNPDGTTTVLYTDTTGQGENTFILGEKERNDLANSQAERRKALSALETGTGKAFMAANNLTSLKANEGVRQKLLINNTGEFVTKAKERGLELFDAAAKSDIQRNTALDVNGIPSLQGSSATEANTLLRLGASLEALENASQYGLTTEETQYVAKEAARQIEEIAGKGAMSRPELHYASPIIRAIKEKYDDNDPETVKAWDRIALVSSPETASPMARDFNEFSKGKAAERLRAKAMEQLPDVFYAKESLNETSPDYTKALFAYAKRISLLSPNDIARLQRGEVTNLPPEDAKSIADHAFKSQRVLAAVKEIAAREGLDPKEFAFAAPEETPDTFMVFNERGEAVKAVKNVKQKSQGQGAIKKEADKPEPKEAPKREPGVNLEPVRDFESQMEAFNRPVQNTGPDDAAGVGILDRIRQDAEQRRESRRMEQERGGGILDRIRQDAEQRRESRRMEQERGGE